MNKDTEELLKAIIKGYKDSGSSNFFIGAIQSILVVVVVLTAVTSFYFTKKYYENKVDPEVLFYIKSPEAAKETEQKIAKILNHKKRLEIKVSELESALIQKENRLKEIDVKYSEIKEKMFNEKVIYDEAFQDRINQIELTHKNELKKVQEQSYDQGVGSGVIGTLGVQMLLED